MQRLAANVLGDCNTPQLGSVGAMRQNPPPLGHMAGPRDALERLTGGEISQKMRVTFCSVAILFVAQMAAEGNFKAVPRFNVGSEPSERNVGGLQNALGPGIVVELAKGHS